MAKKTKATESAKGTISTHEDTDNLSAEQKLEAQNFFSDIRKVTVVKYGFDDDGVRRPRVFTFIPELNKKGQPVVNGEGDQAYCVVTYLSQPRNGHQELRSTTRRTPFFVKEAMKLQVQAQAKIESVRNALLLAGPIEA
jgi:hypothetical protein